LKESVRLKIESENITKRFANVIALDNVNLSINDKELYTLLGPSGCGKTTFLRSLAGFELVDSGKILFDGVDVTLEPAHKRNTGMVFQNYALWPHMTVFENVAYGLKIRRTPKDGLNKRVRSALEMVKLGGLEKRTPHQLSGGQQQRVAVARALVINPEALLFDEPLSNLDAKLRLEMRAEIKRIQRDLGITTVYVTHDQEEAMSISDRIAIMQRGKVMQVGSSKDIYFRPENSFVADFIGQGTFFKGKVTGQNHFLSVTLEGGRIVKAVPSDPADRPKTGEDVLVAIRPENFQIGGKAENKFECVIYHISFLGKTQRVQGKMGDLTLILEADPDIPLEVGERVEVSAEPEHTLAIKLTETH
jgi:spermidine/putrescine ABC transporter ATP-binding subunit